MEEAFNHLYGSCACERNQYTIAIPSSSPSLVEVFFDNSTANRRTQASPVTAWLRVPLDWYQSCTIAHFPDETHSSIRKTFNSPASQPSRPPTRKQFCGYCGTHLTAWNDEDEDDFMDVTLASLFNESLEKLEALQLLPDVEEDDVDTEGTEREVESAEASVVTQRLGAAETRQMQHRGIPYFEEMVENSRLGKMKRQKGVRTNRDGTTTVQWEVIEMTGDENEPLETVTAMGEQASPKYKRQKVS